MFAAKCMIWCSHNNENRINELKLFIDIEDLFLCMSILFHIFSNKYTGLWLWDVLMKEAHAKPAALTGLEHRTTWLHSNQPNYWATQCQTRLNEYQPFWNCARIQCFCHGFPSLLRANIYEFCWTRWKYSLKHLHRKTDPLPNHTSLWNIKGTSKERSTNKLLKNIWSSFIMFIKVMRIYLQMHGDPINKLL